DREVAAVEVLARARDRQRLKRLGGGAEVRDEAGVAGRRDHAALPHSHGVHEVHRFHDRATTDDYPERLQRGERTRAHEMSPNLPTGRFRRTHGRSPYVLMVGVAESTP